jgi:hypothetical protein
MKVEALLRPNRQPSTPQYLAPVADIGAARRVALQVVQMASAACRPMIVAGDLDAAIEACTAEAYDKCEARDLTVCPRRLEAARVDEVAERLRVVGVPLKFRRLVVQAMPRRESPTAPAALPLWDSDALRLVRAFHARRPTKVDLQCAPERPVTFDGSEWICMLGGDHGRAKTTASAWFIANTPSAGFIEARDLDRGLIDALRMAEQYPYPIVLDEVGAEKNAAAVSDILHARHARELLTLANSNTDAEDFEKRYGVRTLDRVHENGRFVVLVGDSYRQHAPEGASEVPPGAANGVSPTGNGHQASRNNRSR